MKIGIYRHGMIRRFIFKIWFNPVMYIWNIHYLRSDQWEYQTPYFDITTKTYKWPAILIEKRRWFPSFVRRLIIKLWFLPFKFIYFYPS